MNKNFPTIDLEKVDKLVQYNFQHVRSYASFFEWKNPDDPEMGKKVKERGIVCDLIKSLEKYASRELFRSVRYGDNPPDAVVTDTNGDLVGCEVTEFVDEETVKAWSKGIGDYKEWKVEEVIKKIERILTAKSKKLATSPYAKNILVMHTDEQDLCSEINQYEIALSRHSFQKVPHVDEAFLLFSYFPGRETYPYLKLNFQ